MCGICGIYNFSFGAVDERALRAMNARLVHRGPDDEGYFISARAGLAMRRLAIIDIAGGNQPVFNENRSVAVVMNGEIYNFQELRKELIGEGHVFRSAGDAEVIAHLYEKHGNSFPEYLRGMFAIALYDLKEQKLFLVRDRIGKKPLYYACDGKRLIFSSEITSLMSAGGISREIDMQALDLFLSLQCVPSPYSIYKAVKKLPPASMLIALPDNEKGRAAPDIRISRYWAVPAAKKTSLGAEEAAAELFRITEESVKLRMVSEVPLGAFLSGGLDSSVVVALMARNSSRPVKTFSIGFREERFSELDYARSIAEKYGTEHTEFIVEDDMLADLDRIACNYGEPFADPSMLPSYFVSRETKRKVTVALNGDGGDEVFGGYNRYRAMMLEQKFFAWLPASLKQLAIKMFSAFPKEAPFGLFWKAEKFLQMSKCKGLDGKYLYARSFLRYDDFERLCSLAYADAAGGLCCAKDYMAGLFQKNGAGTGLSALDRMIYADFHSWLPDCLMAKMDIASMANSLEARSPLLDHKLVEFAWQLPPEMKIRGYGEGGTKWLMKKAFACLLPDKIRRRGKMGFGIPLGQWFRGRLKKRWAETCLSDKALKRGLFRKDALERLLEEHSSGHADNGYKMWALLLLEIWFENFAEDFRL